MQLRTGPSIRPGQTQPSTRISQIASDDLAGRSADLQHTSRPQPRLGDVRALHSGRLPESARIFQTGPTWVSAGPQTKASPGRCGRFSPAFVTIKDGYSRRGAFSALNLDYLNKPYVLGAKNCSDVLSQAAAQPHRVRTWSTLHRHVSMVLLKRCGESHVTPIRSQAARDGRRRKRHKRHFDQNPGAGKGLGVFS